MAWLFDRIFGGGRDLDIGRHSPNSYHFVSSSFRSFPNPPPNPGLAVKPPGPSPLEKMRERWISISPELYSTMYESAPETFDEMDAILGLTRDKDGTIIGDTKRDLRTEPICPSCEKDDVIPGDYLCHSCREKEN